MCCWRPGHEQGAQQQGLVAGAAGVPAGGVQCGGADDDCGQLFGAGHLRPVQSLFRRRRLVSPGATRPGLARCLAAPVHLFGLRAVDRDPAGHRHRPDHADQRAHGLGLPDRDGHPAADPLECGRHHLADLRPRRHWPARRHAGQAWGQLQLCRRPLRRLAHRAGDGRVALDVVGGAAVLFGPARHTRCLLPGRPHRPGFGLGGVPPYPAAEVEERAADRGDAALHGQLHDLHRAVRADRWRARQCHHVP
ncbi:hypothetical protein D3C81_1226820 [compost metagenome]